MVAELGIQIALIVLYIQLSNLWKVQNEDISIEVLHYVIYYGYVYYLNIGNY